MPDYKTHTLDITELTGKSPLCSLIAQQFEDELNELHNTTLREGREVLTIFYEDGDGFLDHTDMVIGSEKAIKKKTFDNLWDEIPNDANFAIILHTHGEDDIFPSISDMVNFVRQYVRAKTNRDVPLIGSMVLSETGPVGDRFLTLSGLELDNNIPIDKLNSKEKTLSQLRQGFDLMKDNDNTKQAIGHIEAGIDSFKEVGSVCIVKVSSLRNPPDDELFIEVRSFGGKQ